MPKLKTHKIKLLGVDIDLPITVRPKTGLFTVRLPSDIRNRLAQIQEEFSTLDECIKTVNQYVQEVNQMETKVEWILAYQIWTELKKNHCDPQGKLQIIYTPLKKTTKGKEVIYNYLSYDYFDNRQSECPIPRWHPLGNTLSSASHNYSGMAHPDSSKSKILPLTVENLTFFQNLCDELGKLNERLEEFLKDPVELETKIIESKGMKLLSE
jgi:hypothetical protein